MVNDIFSYTRYSGSLKFVPGLEHLSGKHVVWWFGGIRKNERASTVPLVSIVLKRIDENGYIGNRSIIDVALTYLVFLRIGTVVEGGRCVGYASNFTALPCVLNQRVGDYQIRGNDIFNLDCFIKHPLKNKDLGNVLEFNIGNSKKVLIPCIVYFIYCYGFSAELKRILLTYSWPEVLTRICGPLDGIKNVTGLVVNLPKRLTNNDAVFIAHVLYDSYAHSAAKSLYAQLEVDFQNHKRKYTALTVRPWFVSPMPVEIVGKWLDGDTFLTFYFKAISEPAGNPIDIGRQNSTKVKNPNNDPNAKKAFAGIPKTIKDLPLTIVHSNYEPHPDEPSIEVTEPKLQIIGKRREKNILVKENAEYSSGTKKDMDSTGHSASGDPTRSSEGIGRIVQNVDLEDIHQGVLLEMWNAALYLSGKNPELITSVEWLSADGILSKESPPKLIMLNSYKEEDMPHISSEMKSWTYADTETHRLRGILVMKITLTSEEVFIAEIERRHKNRATEETFQGLVFRTNTDIPIVDTVSTLIDRIRASCGVMSNVVDMFPIAYSFNHAPSGKENVHCENSIINALRKMNVNKDILKSLRAGNSKAT